METEAKRGEQRARVGAFLSDPTVESRRVGPPRVGGAILCVWRDVLDALVDAARVAEGPAHAAILLGRAGQTPGGVVTEILAWADFEPVASEAEWTRELLRTWDVTVTRVSRTGEGIVPCGWVRVRRGAGAEMTSEAALTHRTFFGLPWQVTLLVDPDTEELGFWGAAPDGQLVNIGFTVLSRRQTAKE